MKRREGGRFMGDVNSPKPVSKSQVEYLFKYMTPVLLASSDEERDAAIADGIITYGGRFVHVWREVIDAVDDDQKAQYREIAEQVVVQYMTWMKGRNLTRRPDENERRALAGIELIDDLPTLWQMYHYAAQAILNLPENHPKRDVQKARAAVLDEWVRLRAMGDEAPWIFCSGVLALIYNQRWVSDEILAGLESEAHRIAAHLDPEDAVKLWSEVEGFYLGMCNQEVARWLPEAERIRALIEALPLEPHDRALDYLGAARKYVVTDDQARIAELYRQALEIGDFRPAVERRIAVMEARVRMAYGDDARAIELLSARIEGFEEDVITAINDEDQAETGTHYAEASALLAFAHARRGEWTGAVEAIERGKCLRQRYTRALRRTPEAASLLEIESELYALSRGLPTEKTSEAADTVRDWFANGLSPDALLRQEYYSVLPAIDKRLLRAPDVAEIGASLRDGEAALSLGIWWTGTMSALIVKGDTAPSWTLLREDATQADVGRLLVGPPETQSGFLIALELGMGLADPRPDLDALLAYLDGVIGRPVAEALAARGLRRLVVLPHNMLRLTPLWALKSWEEFDVRMAPGAFALVDGVRPAVKGKALIVANPTLDLPLAGTEAAVASAHLAATGLTPTVLEGVAATEDALARGLEDANLLHFAGHGIAALTNASRAALLVSPAWADTPVAGIDELLALAEGAAESPNVFVERDEASPRWKIFYEYARRGTLYAEVENDRALLTGELWRAGDILVQGTLEHCALAFLCACSSGLGSIPNTEEESGLPAALQLAGVGCVIGTGWPVADEITVLFADEFYRRLAEHAGGAFDVVAAVRGAAAILREMSREEAVKRVEALAASAKDRGARFRLKTFAKRLSTIGFGKPFSHPFESGAFFVTGAAEVSMEAVQQ